MGRWRTIPITSPALKCLPLGHLAVLNVHPRRPPTAYIVALQVSICTISITTTIAAANTTHLALPLPLLLFILYRRGRSSIEIYEERRGFDCEGGEERPFIDICLPRQLLKLEAEEKRGDVIIGNVGFDDVLSYIWGPTDLRMSCFPFSASASCNAIALLIVIKQCTSCLLSLVKITFFISTFQFGLTMDYWMQYAYYECGDKKFIRYNVCDDKE